MKIIISLLLGLLLFGCVQPEDIGNEQHIKKKILITNNGRSV